MEILSPADFFLLKAGAFGASAYAARSLSSRFFSPKQTQPDLPLLTAAKNAKPPALAPTRSILKQLEQNGKACMVFYGSQTGTAERFAQRFAREALSRYDLGCVVADLDDYDFGDILRLTKTHLIVFILATYGEGEPTDNAIIFQNFVNSEIAKAELQSLHYSVFGLGSSSYTHYNAMIRRLDESLSARDAQRVGSLGMGDDGKGTLEDDFATWLDTTLPPIASHFNLSNIPFTYRPAFEVMETIPEDSVSRHVFLGEPNKAHLYNRIQGPFTPQNPFPAKITQARELFTTNDRSCLHLEFDVSGTSIAYDTGDHLAVWPVNSDQQVQLFLDMFNLSSKRNYTIEITSTDPSNKVPIPARTTYETVLRHYLDICAPVTRQDLQKLSDFATSEELRTSLSNLATDKTRFAIEVTSRQLTISQLLAHLCANSNTIPAINVPFSLILETIPKLRPRHYSISSSSLTSRKTISITVVNNAIQDLKNNISFTGVSTSYLSALKNARDSSDQKSQTHTLHLPKISNSTSDPSLHPLIHIRRSKFRPPFTPSTPIIMIGPGTGIAPFRAFIHERAHQFSQGRTIGRTILFYGCRSPTQDYLYKEDWEDLTARNALGEGVFSIYTAFSREKGQPKRYVQDLIAEEERADEIRRLIGEEGARVYVCGNAGRMARDIARVMGEILGGGEVVAGLKREGRWCEDVW